jgi:hypothetical protein
MGVDLQQDRGAVPRGLGEWNQRPAIASSVPSVNDHPLDLAGASKMVKILDYRQFPQVKGLLGPWYQHGSSTAVRGWRRFPTVRKRLPARLPDAACCQGE